MSGFRSSRTGSKPLMMSAVWRAWRAGADPEIDVGRRNFQLGKENVRQILVVVLAGVHERLPHSGPRLQGMQHGRSLHEIGTGSDYVQNVHTVSPILSADARQESRLRAYISLRERLDTGRQILLFVSGLRAGVELKWRPIERIVVRTAMQQRKLGRAQGRVGTGSFVQFVVETVHQLFGRCVGDFPEAGDHVVRSGSQESPGESYQAFAGIGAFACAVARRNRNQVGLQRMLHNVARIELERVGFARGF